MTFKLQDKDIKQIVEKRQDISYYNITAGWLNGFIEAEGSFFETCGEGFHSFNVRSITLIMHFSVQLKNL